jgi:hypothetical protein
MMNDRGARDGVDREPVTAPTKCSSGDGAEVAVHAQDGGAPSGGILAWLDSVEFDVTDEDLRRMRHLDLERQARLDAEAQEDC